MSPHVINVFPSPAPSPEQQSFAELNRALLISPDEDNHAATFSRRNSLLGGSAGNGSAGPPPMRSSNNGGASSSSSNSRSFALARNLGTPAPFLAEQTNVIHDTKKHPKRPARGSSSPAPQQDGAALLKNSFTPDIKKGRCSLDQPLNSKDSEVLKEIQKRHESFALKSSPPELVCGQLGRQQPSPLANRARRSLSQDRRNQRLSQLGLSPIVASRESSEVGKPLVSNNVVSDFPLLGTDPFPALSQENTTVTVPPGLGTTTVDPSVATSVATKRNYKLQEQQAAGTSSDAAAAAAASVPVSAPIPVSFTMAAASSSLAAPCYRVAIPTVAGGHKRFAGGVEVGLGNSYRNNPRDSLGSTSSLGARSGVSNRRSFAKSDSSLDIGGDMSKEDNNMRLSGGSDASLRRHFAGLGVNVGSIHPQLKESSDTQMGGVNTKSNTNTELDMPMALNPAVNLHRFNFDRVGPTTAIGSSRAVSSSQCLISAAGKRVSTGGAMDVDFVAPPVATAVSVGQASLIKEGQHGAILNAVTPTFGIDNIFENIFTFAGPRGGGSESPPGRFSAQQAGSRHLLPQADTFFNRPEADLDQRGGFSAVPTEDNPNEYVVDAKGSSYERENMTQSAVLQPQLDNASAQSRGPMIASAKMHFKENVDPRVPTVAGPGSSHLGNTRATASSSHLGNSSSSDPARTGVELPGSAARSVYSGSVAYFQPSHGSTLLSGTLYGADGPTPPGAFPPLGGSPTPPKIGEVPAAVRAAGAFLPGLSNSSSAMGGSQYNSGGSSCSDNFLLTSTHAVMGSSSGTGNIFGHRSQEVDEAHKVVADAAQTNNDLKNKKGTPRSELFRKQLACYQKCKKQLRKSFPAEFRERIAGPLSKVSRRLSLPAAAGKTTTEITAKHQAKAPATKKSSSTTPVLSKSARKESSKTGPLVPARRRSLPDNYGLQELHMDPSSDGRRQAAPGVRFSAREDENLEKPAHNSQKKPFPKTPATEFSVNHTTKCGAPTYHTKKRPAPGATISFTGTQIVYSANNSSSSAGSSSSRPQPATHRNRVATEPTNMNHVTNEDKLIGRSFSKAARRSADNRSGFLKRRRSSVASVVPGGEKRPVESKSPLAATRADHHGREHKRPRLASKDGMVWNENTGFHTSTSKVSFSEEVAKSNNEIEQTPDRRSSRA